MLEFVDIVGMAPWKESIINWKRWVTLAIYGGCFGRDIAFRI